MADEEMTPRAVCRALLAAMSASEGRRRRRKRDTTPDAIGLGIKRELLQRIVDAGPVADELEGWLVNQCVALAVERGYGPGAVRAMARDVYAEWCLALEYPSFRDWLARGAPSADADEPG